MDSKLVQIKKDYYNCLDAKARHIARVFISGHIVTPLLLSYISELYQAAQIEKRFEKENFFDTAYHAPISSDLEFLIARTLHHFSNTKKLGWKVSLRKQFKKTAPDILIRKNNDVIGIIEVKAKAGWIQTFFSSERVEKDKIRLKNGQSNFNPEEFNEKMNDQLKKYAGVYKARSDQVFLLLPTLSMVHRKKSNREMGNYQDDFAKNSGLERENLILLSNNLMLDLATNPQKKDYNPTTLFENLVEKLEKFSSRQF